MARLSRRFFLQTATVGAAGLTSSGASAQTPAPAGYDAAAMAASISAKLFADDGMARPVPDTPTVSNLAKGLDRTLVLGGGGEYYVAWYCGFFHGLLENGVDLNDAQMVVGTSAGAYAGSSLTSGEFQRLRRGVRVLRSLPRPVRQARARDRPQHQPAAGAGDQLQRQGRQPAVHPGDRTCRTGGGQQGQWAPTSNAWPALLTGDSRTDWPIAKMYTTANDCYTGERLVIGQEVARRNKIPLAHAAAASSSLPGVIGPTLLGQRYCMDGGISKTWAHTDVVAGSKRALVITLTNGYEGSLLSGIPHNVHTEMKNLEATGTKGMLIIAGTPKDVNLLDPKQIEPALRAGYERSKSEAEKIRMFWGLG